MTESDQWKRFSGVSEVLTPKPAHVYTRAHTSTKTNRQHLLEEEFIRIKSEQES